MTPAQGFLWVAEGLMFFALGCFVRGFRVRKTNLPLHMFLGKLGAFTVLSALLVLEVLMRGLDWEFPVRDHVFLRCHLTAASIALATLLLLLFTGITRRRRVHIRLYWVFFPSYALTLLFSLLAFDLGL